MRLSHRRKLQLARGAGRQLARFTRAVLRTSDVHFVPEDGQNQVLEDYPPIIAVWHGQFMMVASLQPEGFEADAIVARHGDAEVIAEALKPFNVQLVRGAGSAGRKFKKERGGVRALREAVRTLKSGRAVVTTADVPPGPARVAGAGIVTLARLSGRPIVPVAVATSRYRSLNTWSRMTINLPYSKLVCVVGEKIWVPAEASAAQQEQLRQLVEQSLRDATAKAYENAGVDATRATPPAAMDRTAPRPKPGPKLKLYRGLTHLARPLAPMLIRYRARRGKEDQARSEERYGTPSIDRPNNHVVVWVHAASVGETNAVLPVVNRLLDMREDIFVVLTTGTVTSAAMAKTRLGPRACHQFVPIDTPAFARRFLNHWQPDLAIFTESEIWPNLILEASQSKTPIALVNARMSKRSHSRWRKNRGLSLPLFARLDTVLAQNAMMARRFSDLGARHVITAGNLKVDAPPPPINDDALGALTAAVAGRPVLVAASTHEGEEQEVIAAHRVLQNAHPQFLTIIVPRHPERASAISEVVKQMGLRVGQRTLDTLPQSTHDVFIADTIGELGLYYKLSKVAFIGGSLVAHGGQNPLEAVGLDAAIVTGPSQHNFADIYGALLGKGGARQVQDAKDLAETVHTLMSNADQIEQMTGSARDVVREMGGALEATLGALVELLPQQRGEQSRAAE